MNKLLQHIIDAGDVDHRVLPGLQKMQKGGTDWLSKYKQDLKNMPNVNLSSNDNIPRQPAYVKEYEQQQQFLKNKKEREQKELLEREFNNRTYISQDRSTPASREADRQRRLEAQRQEAMANSELAQTFGSFTPSGNNSAAGAVAANQFVKTVPIILAGAAGASALPSVLAGLNAPIAGVAGLTGTNLINAGFAYQGAKNIPNVASSIKKAYQNPTWGNVGNAALETGVTALDMTPFAAEAAPAIKQAGRAVKNVYNTVATGESALPIAWKSSAKGLSQEASDVMFKGIANTNKLSDADRALLLNYQYDSKPFTGRGILGVNQEKRQALNNIINNNELNFNNNAILTRRFNPENKSLGAEFINNNLNLGSRPTSFSAGIGLPNYNSGAVDRLVVPNRYAKKMGSNLLANEYGIPSNKTFDLLNGDVQNFAAARGVMPDDIINAEREVIGTGLDFKRIGKVRNDIGGYDHIVKPRQNSMPSGQAFGPSDSNSGLLNYLKNTDGTVINPLGVAADHAIGAYKGLYNQGRALLKGIPRRPFFESFPITEAQKAKVMGMQDQALKDATDFTNDYWYGNSSTDIRPILEQKMREILPDLKMASNQNNLERTINGVDNPLNPFTNTNDILVKNTTFGKGREGLTNDVINYLDQKRGIIGGVNDPVSGTSITLRNSGKYYKSPKEIANIVAHESGHTAQKFGVLSKQQAPGLLNTPSKSWGEVATQYDPKYDYFTSNPDTELGRRFKDALVEPKKSWNPFDKQTWRSSPNELHSELMAGKYNLYKQAQREGISAEEAMNRVTNPMGRELNWLLENKNLNTHFKPTTPHEEKLNLLKLLPAAIPAVGAAAAMGAKEQKYGGENNMFRVFAQDGTEYKGSSIVDYLATKGYSGNKAFRKGLAEKYGVEDYNYSAAKNTELLNKLRENDDLLEKEYEQTQAPIAVEKMMQMEQRQSAPVRNTQPLYRPSFMDEEIPKTKVNMSLQPKVVYDKFSLTPKMVIPMPVTPRAAVVNTPAPVVQPTVTPTPQINIPKFDPYSFMRSGVKNPVVAIILFNSRDELLHRSNW